jgi:small subunit ribosomal protein S1
LEIVVAKTAGFCFGVSKAVQLVNSLLERADRQIYTLGEIIHNKQLIDRLKLKGVRVINDVSETGKFEGSSEKGCIVIRAHGVTPDVYELIRQKRFDIADATCPYVKKIHNLVREKFNEGYQIIVVGNREHPEVKGISGWCENTAYIINSVKEADELPESDRKTFVVAQTTMTSEKWNAITELLKVKFKNMEKFDTICNATISRQEEAAGIAQTVNCMIVVGDRNSSNTQKLYEICKKHCSNTYKIEIAGELPPLNIKKIKRLGITAGASTPDWIIKEVIEKMEELKSQGNEMSFKEAFEDSLVTLRTGEIVKGKIIGFNNTEVYVDLGFKSDGTIPVEQFSSDPEFKPEECINIGDEVEAFVVRVNDGEGNVLLSKKKADSIRGWAEIENAFKNKLPIKVKVIEDTKGGLVAAYNGNKIFIPASQVGEKYIKDLKEYLNKTIEVRIIELNKNKKKLVASQRVLLTEKKKQMESELWDNIFEGAKYEGIVKSLTNFGAFVDIGGVDGLVHISELSWTKIKHPSEVLEVGDKVEVTVREFDKEKKRISLGYRKEEDNPWFGVEEKYKVGDLVKGKVVRLVPFGAFVELRKGLDGLVHISQISDFRLGKPGDVLKIGQEVEAKVLEVNIESKKISLSIKEVKPINPAVESNTEAETTADEKEEKIPNEHKESMSVTIGEMIGDIEEAVENKSDANT